MPRRAQEELELDLERSFVVGDRWHDVELAQGFGGWGVLVRTGYGEAEVAKPKPGVEAALVAPELMTAVSLDSPAGRTIDRHAALRLRYIC